MDLEFLEALPGDVVIPPAEGFANVADDEAALLVWADDDGYVCMTHDDEDEDTLAIHPSQVDDLINALKTVKENNGW